MTEIKQRLIALARERFGTTSNPSGRDDPCFTIYNGLLMYWFNTADGSTHMLAERLNQEVCP